jgi:hypothetical protein
MMVPTTNVEEAPFHGRHVNGRVRKIKPPSAREQKMLGQVRDVDGVLWNVLGRRPTPYGFDLLMGLKASGGGRNRTGLAQLIATKALHDYWAAIPTGSQGENYALPAGRSTLKRMRKRLGFNAVKGRPKFWKMRCQDLETLSAAEFVAKHQVTRNEFFAWRERLVGQVSRNKGWWRKPSFLAVLRSNVPLRVVAEKLGIGLTHSSRLRRQLTAEDAAAAQPQPIAA